MLWRALKHVKNGFYIDLGAQDPVVDSVSLAFHERGWKGIHVEPTPYYAQMLREQRPSDTVIEAAVSSTADLLTFFEIPGTGISTGDPKIAEQHRERGFATREITVPCVRLSSVFKACGNQVIHWMKVDVEGFEWSALASWGKASARPWIVVVESTLPLTQIESHEQWEPLLLRRGYTPVYFDGLNRYYVSKEKAELRQAFSAPPNVFDDFSVNGTASTSFHHHLKARHTAALAEIDAQVLRGNIEIEDLRQTLAARDMVHGEQMRERLSQLNDRNEEVLQLERARAAREEKSAADSSLQGQQKEELLRQIAALEQATATKLLDWQQKADRDREQLHHHYSARETEIGAQILAIQQEYGNQLEAMRRETAAANALLATAHAEQLNGLRQQLTKLYAETAAHRLAMEQEAAKKLEISRNEVNDHLLRQLAIEREAEQHLDAIRREFADQKLELLRAHDAEASSLKQALLTQERQFSAQMLAFHEQATRSQRTHEAESANRILELSRQHANVIAAVHQEAGDQQRYLQGQLELVRRSVEDQREHAQAQSDNLRRELESSAKHVSTLEEAYRTRELGLLAQLDHLQESRLQVQQMVQRLRMHVSAMRSSFSWRLTAPARKFATLFFPSKIASADIADDLMTPALPSRVENIASQVTDVPRPNSISSEDIMQPTANQIVSSGAVSVPAVQGLMESDDQEFVQRAYHLVFGRNADPAGGGHYLDQLQKGSSRLLILSQLRLSQEGIARAATYPQLDDDLAVATSARPAAATFKELVALQGLGFVRAAYLTMLGREPDPAGMNDYVSLLGGGSAKVGILAQLQKSEERQSRMASFQVVTEAVRQFRKSGNASGDRLLVPSGSHAVPNVAAPQTMDDLLKCDEQEFLQVAFMLLLGRAPDPEAFGAYLNHLGAGVPRLQLLEAIEGSAEATNRAIFLATIDRAIRHYQIATIPIFGSILRLLMPQVEKLDNTSRVVRALRFEHALTAERLQKIDQELKGVTFNDTFRVKDLEHKLAAIEQGLTVMSEVSTQRFDQIQEGMAKLQLLTVQQGQELMNANQLGGRMTLAAVDLAPGQIPELRDAGPEGLSQLPPRAREIYVKLREQANRHQVGVR